MEEDLHMALCVVKVLALVVIASALWSMSGGAAYMTDASAYAQGTNANSNLWLGPSAGLTETSQPAGPFGNRYEPPVFWNIGNISDYEQFQSKESRGVIGYVDKADAEQAAAEAAAKKGGFRGYASGPGINIKGYATGVPSTDGLVPNYA